MIPQEIKDRVPKIKAGTQFTTTHMGKVHVRVSDIDLYDDTANIEPDAAIHMDSLDGRWVDANDCLELAVFFKKLAKKLRKK